MNEIWAEENFGNSELGDRRLSKRLLTIVNKMVSRPEGSIPQQMGEWKDVKACYSFFRNKKVLHKRVQATHVKRVKEKASNKSKTYLYIQDTSELNYSGLEMTKNLGFIGNHANMGLMFHNCIAIEPHESNPKIIGLANQEVWVRKESSLNKTLTRHERNKRTSESDIWLKTIKAVGKPPEGVVWVSIGDRTNDIFEFFEGSRKEGWEAVVRASQNRCIEVDGKETYLMEHMRSLKSMGTKVITIRREGDPNANTIELNISWDKVTIQPPHRLGTKKPPIEMSVIRCWNEEKEIEWILYSSIIIEDLEGALEKIKWYSHRWIIEEYHKCLKTGCRIESRQQESAKSLKAVLGVLSIIAILMLQLRNIARDDTEVKARTVVDMAAVKIITRQFNLSLDVTVGIFWRSVARLGGFIGRKSDGQPGWQTLWKGWLRLLDMLCGYECLQPS